MEGFVTIQLRSGKKAKVVLDRDSIKKIAAPGFQDVLEQTIEMLENDVEPVYDEDNSVLIAKILYESDLVGKAKLSNYVESLSRQKTLGKIVNFVSKPEPCKKIEFEKSIQEIITNSDKASCHYLLEQITLLCDRLSEKADDDNVSARTLNLLKKLNEIGNNENATKRLSCVSTVINQKLLPDVKE